MNTKQLRQKILDLAIRGKLVPQDPNDEPASVLLERIRAEKEQLIKEGKIKRDKKDSSIVHGDDKSHYGQFEIPENWKWVKLAEIGQIVGGGTPKTTEKAYWENGNIPWITPADLSDYSEKYISHGRRNITEKGLQESSVQIIPKGTVLFSSRAPIGYVAIADNKVCTNQGFKSFVPYIIECNEYGYYFLTAQVEEIRSRASGTTFKEISGTEMGNTFIPLPPLAEQKRIVASIESSFEIIKKIELSKIDLQSAVMVAKSKILSLAIRGKLVPQDPTDEPASILLERIRFEKERLIKEGKIKRNKNDSVIIRGDDNSHYEKIHLGEVCRLLNTPEINSGTLPYLDVRYLRCGTSPEYKEKGRFIESGTPVILVDGENSGEIFYIPENGYMGSTFRELSILKEFDTKFILLFISYYRKELKENKTGSAIPHLNKKLFAELPVPLIPLNTQRKIAETVNYQFLILDEIISNC